LAKAHGVEHTVFRHAALAGNGDAPFHEVKFTDRIRIGVDAERAPEFERLAVQGQSSSSRYGLPLI
jgi:hypothetical protein